MVAKLGVVLGKTRAARAASIATVIVVSGVQEVQKNKSFENKQKAYKHPNNEDESVFDNQKE